MGGRGKVIFGPKNVCFHVQKLIDGRGSASASLSHIILARILVLKTLEFAVSADLHLLDCLLNSFGPIHLLPYLYHIGLNMASMRHIHPVFTMYPF